MDALTEESLNKFNRRDLITLVASLKSNWLDRRVAQNEGEFDQMKSDVSVTKNVNTIIGETTD